MSLHVIAADAPKITDWWTAGVATSSLIATIVVGVGVAIFANGYRMRIRAVRDDNRTVQVRVFNSGRIRGEVGPIELVVRSALFVRILRRLARKPVGEERIETADPKKTQALEPGQTRVWRVQAPNLNIPRPLPPTIWRPLGEGSERPIKPSQLLVRIDRSLYRARFLRYRRTLPFQRSVWRLSGVLSPLVPQSRPPGIAAPAPAPIHVTSPSSASPRYRLAAAAVAGFLLGALLRLVSARALQRVRGLPDMR